MPVPWTWITPPSAGQAGILCTAEVPIPYPCHLEQAALPQAPAIVEAALRVVRGAS